MYIFNTQYLCSVSAGTCTCCECYKGSLYSPTDLYLSGLVPSKGVDSGRPKDIGENRSVRVLPSKYDWSTKNVIGPILDQQKVSAWAVAVSTL